MADDDGRVAYDYFNLTIKEACYQLNINLDAGFDDIDYRVHSTKLAQTETGTYTITNDSTCTITTTIKAKLQGTPDSDYQDITVTSPVDYTGWLTPSGSYGIQVHD